MAATQTSGSGTKNYYNIAYGKLSGKAKEVPQDSEPISKETLKAETQKVSNLDLRNRHVETGKDKYPYVLFYDELEGVITKIEKIKPEGFQYQLSMEVLSKNGDLDTVQCKFYNKYTENILNRLVNVSNPSSRLTLRPYSIPADAEISGKKINFYNQGVSIKEEGVKVELKYSGEDSALPQTERVANTDGEMTTSRVKRIDFLFNELGDRFNNTPANSQPKSEVQSALDEVADDDLPF